MSSSKAARRRGGRRAAALKKARLEKRAEVVAAMPTTPGERALIRSTKDPHTNAQIRRIYAEGIRHGAPSPAPEEA